MSFRLLINIGLLAIPIAATLGVLFGLQSHRTATGQSPLFVDNGLTSSQYCQKAYGISPPSKGEQYTLNPNQWGWNEGDPGHLCVNVTTFNNNTYSTPSRAPDFSVTWQYPQGPETAPVHAFPNIKLDSSLFPTSLQSLSQVNLHVEWTYGIGNDTVPTTNAQELGNNAINTNIAVDMFIDKDQATATDSTKAAYEVMVWLAKFGDSTQPIGLAQGAVATQVLDGITFSLYAGQNSLQQNVLTWVASEMVSSFNGDLSPLITKITSTSNVNFPTGSDYLGYIGLGSEVLWSRTPVTLHVPYISIDVKTSS